MSDTLLVAGGGAGGSQLQGAFEGAGGGGAGGLGHGTLNFVAGTSYTVVIGQGGRGQGMDGENSRIYGGSIAETAYGGGHGGYVAYEPGPFGGSGGSGGGSTGSDFTRVGGNATAGTGSLMYMGNTGGYGINGMGNISTGQDGGGGGGALDAGSPMSEYDLEPPFADHDGGAGYPFLVNGTPYGFYAGGGGGGGGAGKFHEGFGGVGGGGDGGFYNQNGTAGVANSGGGGGGGGSPDDLTDTRPPYMLYATNGGDGGSGVAIFVLNGQILSECPSP